MPTSEPLRRIEENNQRRTPPEILRQRVKDLVLVDLENLLTRGALGSHSKGALGSHSKSEDIEVKTAGNYKIGYCHLKIEAKIRW